MSDPSGRLRIDPATGWVDMSAYQHLNVEHELLFEEPLPLHQSLDTAPPATLDEESWNELIRVVIEDAEPAEPPDEATDVIDALDVAFDLSLEDYFTGGEEDLDPLSAELDFSMPDHLAGDDDLPDPEKG